MTGYMLERVLDELRAQGQQRIRIEIGAWDNPGDDWLCVTSRYAYDGEGDDKSWQDYLGSARFTVTKGRTALEATCRNLEVIRALSSASGKETA